MSDGSNSIQLNPKLMSQLSRRDLSAMFEDGAVTSGGADQYVFERDLSHINSKDVKI